MDWFLIGQIVVSVVFLAFALWLKRSWYKEWEDWNRKQQEVIERRLAEIEEYYKKPVPPLYGTHWPKDEDGKVQVKWNRE